MPSPPDHGQLLEKSTALLGWDIIRNALAGLAYSPATRDRCLDLRPEPDFDGAQKALRETEEMTALDEAAETPPLCAFEDIRPLLDDAAARGILEPEQALHILKFLRLAKSIKSFFAKRSGLLGDYAARLTLLPDFLKELERCISDESEIKDTASPELKQAVRAVREAKDKRDKSVNKLLGSPEFKDAIQDSYTTEREGRLVFPVRSEYKGRIDGIVHDSSGSGATFYMEPTKVIPLNNQLKINRIKVEQEKLRILRHLARTAVEHSRPLLADFAVLVNLDLIHAKRRLAKTLQARRFTFSRECRVRLKGARNPELLLNGQDVVANDICWDDACRVIIISGPNTGGKTVTLKTVGLMALMARAGLLLPLDEDSEIGFFPRVYADIGDEQNIQQSLSTFSAHLGKIVSILTHAPPGSLVLLDELGIATDPLQGAALAEAILLELKRKGMMTLVSTHFLALKTLAQTQEGFLNACTEFDRDSLQPTYKLIFGVPGGSAALETAERLGLSHEIIARARNIYDEKDTRADALLQSLRHQKLRLEKEKASLAERLAETQRLKEEQQTLTQNLRDRELEFQKNKAKRLQGTVRDARNTIHKILRDIKGARDPEKIRAADRQVRSLGRVPPAAVRPDLSEWNVPADKLREGEDVVVDTYGARGKLLENPQGKKKVLVKLGNLETRVETQRLRGRAGDGKTPPAPKPAKPTINLTVESTPPQSHTCDLRGMRMDEAKRALESFIDQAMLNNMGQVKIIHGHGTGAIKKFVRDYLESGGIGKSVTPGPPGEGGDGVTLVEF
ncbi:MAG: endonuclease MutS2 [Nitrospinales bacterium]